MPIDGLGFRNRRRSECRHSASAHETGDFFRRKQNAESQADPTELESESEHFADSTKRKSIPKQKHGTGKIISRISGEG
jgi:hypothetical protein